MLADNKFVTNLVYAVLLETEQKETSGTFLQLSVLSSSNLNAFLFVYRIFLFAFSADKFECNNVPHFSFFVVLQVKVHSMRNSYINKQHKIEYCKKVMLF